jgi:hypothetical protein
VCICYTYMLYKMLLPAFVLFCSCDQQSTHRITKSDITRTNAPVKKPRDSYAAVKTKSAALVKAYQVQPGGQPLFNAEQFIADSLVSYWYDTPWDFNGTTQQPGEGSIACGYFVTTVLRDAGLSLNRVKLAQCASEQMIKTLCRPEAITRQSNQTLEAFVKMVTQKGRGLYIVGLDFHTGLIWHDGEQVYFIHASYARPKKVIKEVALESAVLRSSSYRVLGRIRFGF